MLRLDDPLRAAEWLRARVGGHLSSDSRSLQAGDGFIAWPGAAVDARRFALDALARGAAACLVEASGLESFPELAASSDARLAAYDGLKAACGFIASAFHGEPSRRLAVLAVTGTNGKTSTAWWLASALPSPRLASPIPCGLVGTLGMGVPPMLEPSGLTTADPVRWQRQLRSFVDRGLGACAVEASSIGLAEHRLDGTEIRLALFTNFSRDHLDYHGSMEAYWQAKARLFDWPDLRVAVVNVDDSKGSELAARLQARPVDLWTVAIGGPARLRADNARAQPDGWCFDVVEGELRVPFAAPVLGRYNVSNLLGVIAALRALGQPLPQAVAACEGLAPVPGRLERIGREGQPLVVVDYAHTPDALDQVLAALRPLATARGGRLWCVFGCGGNRDATKRPLMAAIAEKGADRVVVTSDNPRDERPEAIVAQMLLGLSHDRAVEVEVDRARAIAHAIGHAEPADVVLLAGKGHETWQEVAGRRLPFNDRAHAEAALQAREEMTG